jgi:hypothetical protein
MSAIDDEKAIKAAKKAKLRAEAEKLGISYEALKEQKKDKKRRKREADKLTADNDEFDGGKDRQQEQKRMRTWSADFDADAKGSGGGTNGGNAPATKRPRTRSMDKAEVNAEIVKGEKSQSTEEWRKSHNITIRGYGKNASVKVPEPYIEFDDAPFNPTIQKTLKAAGFERPTFVQAQVRHLHEFRNENMHHSNFCSLTVIDNYTGLANRHKRRRHDFNCKDWIRKNMWLPPTIISSLHSK